MAFKKVEKFANDFDEILVIHFINKIDNLDTDRPTVELPENVQLLSIPLTRWHRIAGFLIHPRLPSFASARRVAGRRHIEAAIASNRFTHFFADFAQGLGAVPEEHVARFSFRQHDIVSKLYERMFASATGLRRAALGLELARCLRWERYAWARVDDVVVLNKDDAIEIRAWNDRARVTAEVANDLITFSCSTVPRAPIPGRIMFWGNMSRFENIDAACWFVTEILPIVRHSVPEAHFVIVGAHPTPEVESLEGDFVTVTGFVEDPSEEFSKALVAVAPLRFGSGVKIKVIETIESGIKTIATPVGAEGISPSDMLLVASTSTEIAAGVIAALIGERAVLDPSPPD
ncbi:glycosyltransferase [Pannonibacter tanglangensis]|uniref:Glycosyltransferase n=1 Tax=Pannonibacter tanglangensis TaxID=2750084 RepID=A0ABW9ZD84_9HYPH|nr:glycosyltransferase [Pannonibacter sp. XCT-34]NBN62394.1 glycosyltransferase [Pannonibacter sp. XCT-34]